jgi:hypothetical protein
MEKAAAEFSHLRSPAVNGYDFCSCLRCHVDCAADNGVLLGNIASQHQQELCPGNFFN